MLDEPVGEPRPARATRVPPGPDGGRGRARRQRRALVAPRRRPRAGLRLPRRAGRPRACRWPARSRTCSRRTTVWSAHAAIRERCRRHSRSSRRATPTGRARCSCGRDEPIHDPAWTVEQVSLEDVVLAYMGRAAEPRRSQAPATRGDATMIVGWRGGSSAPRPALRPRLWPRSPSSSSSPAATSCTVYDTNDLAHARREARAAARWSTNFLNKHSALDGSVRLGLLAVAGAHRHLLGRAARRPRARDRHLSAGLDAERQPHALAGGQARPRRRSEHDRRRAAQPDGDLVVAARFDWVHGNRFSPGTFDERGIVAVGYAAFAFALGVTAGLVIRRTLPAMAVTLVSLRRCAARLRELGAPASLAAGAPQHAVAGRRPRVPDDSFGRERSAGWSPEYPGHLEQRVGVLYAEIVDSTGRSATQAALHAFVQSACPSIAAGAPPSAGSGPKGIRAANPDAFQACVTQLSTKFHEVVAYQPANRFWMFQWSETAIFIALALVLCGFCFWWIRRGVG